MKWKNLTKLLAIGVVSGILLLGTVTIATSTVKYVSDRSEWVGLSTDTKPTLNSNAGPIFTETNTGKVYVWNGSAWILKVATLTTALDTLTAVGNFKPVSLAGYSQFTLAFVDSLLGDTSVTIRLRIKLAGLPPVNWGSADAENDSLPITLTGTTYRSYSFAMPVDSAMVQVLSAVGTAGKYWSVFKMANPTPVSK